MANIMQIQVITKVDKTVNEKLGNQTILNNSFVGRSTGSLAPQGQEMLIDQADSKEWILDSATGPTFSLDLLSVLNTTIDKIKFIHIQCYKNYQTVGDVPAPIRFSLQVGGNSLGKMSQFQMANIDGLSGADFTVSNVEASGTDEAILQVVFGIKQ